MSRYASNTTVSVERSKADIERELLRYGAENFGYMTGRTEAIIGFTWQGRRIRFNLPIPDKNDEAFTLTPARGSRRAQGEALAAWEKECRRIYRALLLAISAEARGDRNRHLYIR